jgi:hypothetical protein
MKRIPIIIVTVFAVLPGFGQKIETQKADRTKITRLATTQNHLSVLEFNEAVKEVAVGSSNFKVEWRENKVFIQPLEPNAATNLFIWTASGRQSYELVPAGSVDEMHFAIDEEPVIVAVNREDPPPPVLEQPKVPAGLLMESTPVKVVGSAKIHEKVEIIVQDVYRKDGRVYVRYAIVNRGRTVYLPAAPEVFALRSPRAAQSLVTLANSQLAGDIQLRWKDEAQVHVVHAELQAPVVRPGQTAHGLIAFDLPSQSDERGERTVVKLAFPADGTANVSAVLVL